MSKDKNITLSICGNPDANMGYQQLVAIEPAFYPEDKQYPAVNNNESYYSLQIRPDVTVLIKTVNNVSSYGSGREGRLRIGISIPNGLSVNNPKALVDEIELAFKQNYMTQGLKWQFKKTEYDEAVFQAIIAKHLLKPASTVQRAMTPNGSTAYVFTSKIQDLLADYQYKEFHSFGEIIIAETGNATANVISSLTIPRLPVYDIRLQQPGSALMELEPIVDIHRKCLFTLSPTNTSLCEPITVEFTISELKEANSGDKAFDWGMVSLDERLETVSIIVNKYPEKKLQCRINPTGDKIDLSKVRLESGSSLKQLSDKGNFMLTGAEINSVWKISCPSDSTYSFSPSTLSFSSVTVQSVMVTKREPVVPKKDEPYIPGNVRGEKTPENTAYQRIPVKATVINPTVEVGDLDTNIIFTNKYDGTVYARTMKMKKDGKDRREGKNVSQDYKGEVEIPKEMLNCGDSYSFRIVVPEHNIHFSAKDVELLKGTPIYAGEDKAGSGQKKSMPLLYAILLAVGMLLVGIGCGWGISLLIPSQDKKTEQPAKLVDTPVATNQNQDAKPDVNVDETEDFPIENESNEEVEPAETSNQVDLALDAQKSAQEAILRKKKEYDQKLNRIHTLAFKFSEIPSIESFLSDPDVVKIDNENKGNKLNQLSYQLSVAKLVNECIKDENLTKDGIRTKLSQYIVTSDKSLPQDIKEALCSAFLGDYRKDTEIKYNISQMKSALIRLKECKTYQDVYDIADVIEN